MRVPTPTHRQLGELILLSKPARAQAHSSTPASGPNRAARRHPVPAPARRWATLKQAAEYLNLKEDRTIRGHIAAGLYSAYRLNERVLRVDLNEIDAVMQEIGGGVA